MKRTELTHLAHSTCSINGTCYNCHHHSHSCLSAVKAYQLLLSICLENRSLGEGLGKHCWVPQWRSSSDLVLVTEEKKKGGISDWDFQEGQKVWVAGVGGFGWSPSLFRDFLPGTPPPTGKQRGYPVTPRVTRMCWGWLVERYRASISPLASWSPCTQLEFLTWTFIPWEKTKLPICLSCYFQVSIILSQTEFSTNSRPTPIEIQAKDANWQFNKQTKANVM